MDFFAQKVMIKTSVHILTVLYLGWTYKIKIYHYISVKFCYIKATLRPNQNIKTVCSLV